MAVKHIRSQLKTALATGLDGVLRLALTERGNNLFTPFLGVLPRSIRLPFSVPVKRLGVDMKVPLGGSGVNLNDTIEHLKWAGSWKSRVFERFVKRSQPTFVDIGANTGQTLHEIFATHPDARYIGFEPSLPCAAYLASVIEANRWVGSLILASALASEEGSSPFITDQAPLPTRGRLCNGIYAREGNMTVVMSPVFDSTRCEMR